LNNSRPPRDSNRDGKGNDKTSSDANKPVFANNEQETSSRPTSNDGNDIKSTIANLLSKKSISKKLIFVQVFVCLSCHFETADEVVLYTHVHESHPQHLSEQKRFKTQRSKSPTIEAKTRTEEAAMVNKCQLLTEQKGFKRPETTPQIKEALTGTNSSYFDGTNTAHSGEDHLQEGPFAMKTESTVNTTLDETQASVNEMDFQEHTGNDFEALDVSFEETERMSNGQTDETPNETRQCQVSKTEEIEDKKFTCQICNYSTNFKEQMNRHVRRNHLKVKNFECDGCAKRFYEKSELKLHVTNNYISGELKCKLLGSIPKDPFQEKIENLISNKEYPTLSVATKRLVKFACQLCDYESDSKPHMRRHVRMRHLKDRPFECQACKRKFCEKRVLARHIAKYTRQDSSVLSCSLSISRTEEEMAKYVSGGETGQKFRCSLCEISYVKKADVIRHLRSIHSKSNEDLSKDLVSQEITPELLSSQLELNNSQQGSREDCMKHILIEKMDGVLNYLCQICDYNSKWKQTTMRHVRTVHMKERAFQCGKCGKKYSDKRHLRNHIVKCNAILSTTKEIEEI
jgi:hypothetical protein